VNEREQLDVVERTLNGLGLLIHSVVVRELRRWVRRVTVGFALLAIGFGVLYVDARKTVDAQKREARGRVDQTCTLFESSHLADVQQLRQTYRYLLAVPPSERGATINRFVLAGLPAVEKKAHIDTAPPFCDKPGRGLPEPDPRIPPRPSALKP
jgi:hypothetical protein